MSDHQQIKLERDKARAIRKSTWWVNKISDNARCYYCSQSLTKEQTTMDHVVPVSRGGKSTKGNIVVSCKKCNTLKKDMTAFEWVSYLDQLPKQFT